MKTIFDEETRNELIVRIQNIPENAQAQWGKMNLYQMLTHCKTWEEWIQGKGNHRYKQGFIGKLFGRMALKKITRDDQPFNRGVPTSGQFKVKEPNGDISKKKHEWIQLIQAYENYSNPTFIHDFFGRMTKEQIGLMAYKHTDHHLRQFNN
ncbi:DUF1569 domain-containing protein [Fluviicola chungangensis]|uniref:DUF1569 domain-containing protein n=1 Tax=Fluviicola chungangensis TaxID=2597671 RepID=A0A556N6J2_9FLAO|nr:DUF1569 domain-containing protein [Fluviicola chungangensis]TSJ47787.1 DUF1569 domain-containing protein [Fluviicola chungangensis]